MPLLSNEKELLQQLIRSNAHAFRKIYEAYQHQVYTFALYLTKSKDDAEEATQEIFVKLWERRTKLSEETKLLAYVKAMAQNHITNAFKRAALDKAYQQRIFDNMAALHHVSANTLLDEKVNKIYEEALQNLTPQKRLIFTLAHHEGLSYEDIAAKLGISKNTVHNHMVESIKSVKGYVQNHPDITCLIIAILLSAKNS